MKTKIWIFHEKLNLNGKEIGDIDDDNKSNIIDKNDNVDENNQNENEILSPIHNQLDRNAI